jgi:iron complex outermembrane receptor protein
MRSNIARLCAGAAPLAILFGLTAAPALAQTAPAAQLPAASSDDAATPDVVVTGTLFRRTNTETPSPVTVLSADTLAKAGITNINDAVRSISSDGAGSISTGFTNGFSAGGAAVSLRGLGVSSTLVLIDGQRSANFPLNDDGHNAYVDLNSIPFSVVERVEVLKDGASSTYGADAIGGVVNIITKPHFNGVAGTVEGGVSEHGDGARYRANLTLGYGDYAEKGWNFYVNGEYQRDNAIPVQARGFPYNTLDLSSLPGGLDNNTADSSLTTATINAVVRRAPGSSLTDPFGGGVATGTYTSLNLNCANGTYTVAGASGGTACKHDNANEFGSRYNDIQPKQEHYTFSGRLSFRLGSDVEGYVSASYSHNEVVIGRAPTAIRQTQPYGASPALASNNPGIALPVYVCSSGVNCSTAANRTLNPNNPYAAAFAADPANGAARIYYLFGDIPVGTDRTNEVFRGAIGLSGHFEGGWAWKLDAVAARDNLNITSFGVINIAGLKQAINTGAYNFVNPSLNSQAVRDQIAPTFDVPSHTSLLAFDASISKEAFTLPGGPLQVAVGGQVRREVEENNSLNPNLDRYANTSAAFGQHTVYAGFFEINAPILTNLEVNGSGRYDHYSEGFSHFSPKIGFKYTPIPQIAIRGTYSNGFRAPTFAENNPRSSFAGFVSITPPTSFQLAHGGLITAGNTNPYAQAYNIGSGATGNPNLRPEKSRSFTGGFVVEPVHGLSFTVDYYNVKKTDVIVVGPDASTARAAYFAGTALPAGYTVAATDAPDPLFPTALPRVLIINVPYVNAGSQQVSGLDIGANLRVPLGGGFKFSSRVDANIVFNYSVTQNGIEQKYAGTMGPYELSSGAGTPKWRANWQNTLEYGPFSLSVTTYYVSRIKNVAADETAPDASGHIDLSCAENLYGTGDNFCYIKRFIYADLNASVRVNDKFTFNMFVGNFTNAKAPIAPSSYSGTNYLPTWHIAGIVGRTFRAGATFKF